MNPLLAIFIVLFPSLPAGSAGFLTGGVRTQEESSSKSTSPAKADRWLGQRVLIIRHGAEMRTPEKTVWRAYLGEVFTVSVTNGEWLWINEKGGWLWEKDAVLFDTAVEELSRVLTADPTAQNYHLRGVALLAHQQYDRAVADFTESLRLDPRNDGALNNRGQAAYLKGDYEAAVRDFSAAITLEPKNVLAINNRALALISQDKLPEALADLQSVLKQVPDYPEALNNRGVVHQKLDKLDDAIADFSAALKIDPRYVDALGNRASAYRRKGQYSQAITDLELARRISPASFEATNDLAWLLATAPDDSIRQPAKSLELAKQAAALTQFKEWNVLDTYAVALALNGQTAEARTWLATAIELAPEHERPRLQQHLELITAGQPVLD